MSKGAISAIVVAIVAVVGLVIFGGNTPAEEATPGVEMLANGTHEISEVVNVEGIGEANLDLVVTVEGNEITAIEITNNGTTGYQTEAMDELINSFIGFDGTTELDGLAGVTFTSNAVLEAINALPTEEV